MMLDKVFNAHKCVYSFYVPLQDGKVKFFCIFHPYSDYPDKRITLEEFGEQFDRLEEATKLQILRSCLFFIAVCT